MRSQRIAVRSRSPLANRRDNRTGYRPDYYESHQADEARYDRNPHSLRRFSPPEPRRTIRDALSNSLEKRGYSRHFDGDKDNLVSSRAPTRQHGNHSQFNEKFPRRGTSSIGYGQKYFNPDPTILNDDANLRLKRVGDSEITISRIQNEEFEGIGSSSFDRSDVLVNKPVYFEDGTVRTFLALPPESGSILNSRTTSRHFLSSSSSGIPSIGLRKDEEVHYRDRTHPNNVPTRETYDEEIPMFVGHHKEEELRYREKIHPKKIRMRNSYDEEVDPMFYTRDTSFPMVPVSQSKTFGSTSSCLVKEDGAGCPLPFEGYGKESGNFMDPIDHDGNTSASHFDSVRNQKDAIYYHQAPQSPLRGERQGYSFPELGRRKNLDSGYPDVLYRKQQATSQGDYGNEELSRPSYMDPDFERSNRSMRASHLLDHYSVPGEPVSNYLNMKRTPLLTEQEWDLDLGTRVSSHCKITSAGPDFDIERDETSRSYRVRLRNEPMPEVESDIYGINLSARQRLKAKEVDNDSSERMFRRKYIMDVDMSQHNPSRSLSSARNISRQVQGPYGSDKQGNGANLGGLSLSERLNFGRHQYRKGGRPYKGLTTHRASASDDRFSSRDRLAHAQQRTGGHTSIKKRLRPGTVNSNCLDIRKDPHNRQKFRKKTIDNTLASPNARSGDAMVDVVAPVKSGLPEDSDEFKHLIQRAFFRFSKQLNENPAHRRRYMEQGKACGTLLCSVCGSLSKDFVDARSLVKHTFTSLKVGLRADHLGLHKALCVLIGWKSAEAHDDTWVQQVLPDAEALYLKEDLILWPPVVIIHNSSVLNDNPEKRKVVTVEEMDAILRDMGYDGGKTKVCPGKPGNQSIMVVKFNSTLSGLQEAERLHSYYREKKRGRKEYLRIDGIKMEEAAVGQPIDNVDGDVVLYGYMGIAEDLDKLDSGSKSKCILKSKKDIKAIADAPLKTE